MSHERWPRMAALASPAALRDRLAALGVALPCDDTIDIGADAPLARPLALGAGPSGPLVAPNRFVVQPMEGWDGTPEGLPTPLTERRWRRFGASGAGWIWGGEAVAVVREGRANPQQLVLDEDTAPALAGLRTALLEEAERAGSPAPVIGLQLTHSGRWSVPEPGPRRPQIPQRHPLLDRRVGIGDDTAVLSDEAVDALIAAFARAAALAEAAGFDFVDVKHCHGYLLHEFLAARARGGRWGGPSLADRTRLARALIAAVRRAAPRLRIGVRLSLFDVLPHRRDPQTGAGAPEPCPRPYRSGFGIDPDDPARIDLREPIAFVRMLLELGVSWINVTAASPYYAPHVQRPALFPPSDGYPPPEDPVCGVARLLTAARDLARAVPDAVIVSSGWSYLQEWIPHVAQACVREGWFDAVGLGRMALSYPELPADVLAGRPLRRQALCRTFSDCTTAPRNGLVSGCYPLDAFYRERPERAALAALKRDTKPSVA
ncbi:NADH:flavin oxidoreductase [Myxococcota bacterium]|nr:NADH:flavin oxidoreductase [Myxococcota bacterium]MCZ7619724.1 NADH:flavin oxidoreductase [Myxococcota bacterium]